MWGALARVSIGAFAVIVAWRHPTGPQAARAPAAAVRASPHHRPASRWRERFFAFCARKNAEYGPFGPLSGQREWDPITGAIELVAGARNHLDLQLTKLITSTWLA